MRRTPGASTSRVTYEMSAPQGTNSRNDEVSESYLIISHEGGGRRDWINETVSRVSLQAWRRAQQMTLSCSHLPMRNDQWAIIGHRRAFMDLGNVKGRPARHGTGARTKGEASRVGHGASQAAGCGSSAAPRGVVAIVARGRQADGNGATQVVCHITHVNAIALAVAPWCMPSWVLPSVEIKLPPSPPRRFAWRPLWPP